jgi:hypothetical protein
MDLLFLTNQKVKMHETMFYFNEGIILKAVHSY